MKRMRAIKNCADEAPEGDSYRHLSALCCQRHISKDLIDGDDNSKLTNAAGPHRRLDFMISSFPTRSIKEEVSQKIQNQNGNCEVTHKYKEKKERSAMRVCK